MQNFSKFKQIFGNFYNRLRHLFKNIFFHYVRSFHESRIIFLLHHILILFLLLGVFFIFFNIKAPHNFPDKTIFVIEKGQNLTDISNNLKNENLIQSSFWFRSFVIFFGKENNIPAGEYYFEKPRNVYKVARRMATGDYGLTPIKITIIEGYNIFDIADLFENYFDKFNRQDFLSKAVEKEGYLFPDTYYFTPNVKASVIIDKMEDNFNDKISEIENDIKKFDMPIEDVIKMASIVETEARTMEARKMIAGILWKRLEIGMPLQVDVTFKYINGKNSYELTSDDLKIKSPYNTYIYKGLTPTPIANPGIDAILATINPTESDHLYFLSDKSGNMFYAENFEGHLENKRKYLHN